MKGMYEKKIWEALHIRFRYYPAGNVNGAYAENVPECQAAQCLTEAIPLYGYIQCRKPKVKSIVFLLCFFNLLLFLQKSTYTPLLFLHLFEKFVPSQYTP